MTRDRRTYQVRTRNRPQPPPSTPSPSLARFIAYTPHHTRLTSSVTFAAPCLSQRPKAKFIAARGSSRHRLFICLHDCFQGHLQREVVVYRRSGYICPSGDQPDGARNVLLPWVAGQHRAKHLRNSSLVWGTSEVRVPPSLAIPSQLLLRTPSRIRN